MISAVDRAMEILEALSADPRGATVGELIDRLGIEKSVVSRVLSTLEGQGYVVRAPQTNLFRLGLRVVGLALRHLECIGLWEMCMPILQRLSDSTGELTQLAIADETGLTYVAKAEIQPAYTRGFSHRQPFNIACLYCGACLARKSARDTRARARRTGGVTQAYAKYDRQLRTFKCGIGTRSRARLFGDC